VPGKAAVRLAAGSASLAAGGWVLRALRETPAGGAGFGYDPLFVPEGETRTFAEMPEGEKNQLSHRARAWTELATYLRTLVPGDAHRLRP
jgi:XTP/dITP diphosphohydrolase